MATSRDLADRLEEKAELENYLIAHGRIWQGRFDELTGGAAGPLDAAIVHQIRHRPTGGGR